MAVDGPRVLREVSAARALRAEALSRAIDVARSGRPAELRLVEPRLTRHRIEEEWRSLAAVLRREIFANLSLRVLFRSGESLLLGATDGPSPGATASTSQPRPGHFRLGRPDQSFAVEKVLIWAWLTGKGPITRTWLQATVGCSYPTVASVVSRLRGAVERHADRRIEMTYASRDTWTRLFARSAVARSSLRFADRSDRPTSAAGLLDRIRELAPPDVAVGGVAAARHHVPHLDLVGLPRLDVSVHAPGPEADIGFVRRLDPALKPVADPADPAVMVLHFVRHQDPLFVRAASGTWGDPVECLLDLHEAGLESQAVEFLDFLVARAAASP